MENTDKKRKIHCVGDVTQPPLNKRCQFLSNHLTQSLLNGDTIRSIDRTFTHTIDPSITIDDQKSTGTCWIAGGLNTLRSKIIKKLNLPNTFRFSRSYLFFWSKIEKINMILHNACETKYLPKDDKNVDRLYDSFGDGGNFLSFKHLVEKYGLIPHSAYGDDKISENSNLLNKLLSKELLMSIAQIRDHDSDSYDLIPEMMTHYKEVISTVMSVPPTSFIFRFKAKSGSTVTQIGPITPQKFYEEHCGVNLTDYIYIISNPKYEYGKILRMVDKNFVVEREDYDLFNLPIARLIHLTKDSILANNSVYFSCDVNCDMMSSGTNLMDLNLYNYNLIDLNYLKTSLTRKQNIEMELLRTNHAMTICGVDIQVEEISKNEVFDEKTTIVEKKYKENMVKWEVNNSWGGTQSYVMTNDWFIKNVGGIAINKNLLTKEEKEMYNDIVKNNNYIIVDEDPE